MSSMLAVEKVYFFDEQISLKPRQHTGPRSRVWFPGVVGFFLVVSVALFLVLYLTLDAQIVQAQYRIFQLDAAKTRILERNATLSVEAQKLSDLARIEGIARKSLGMDLPRERLLITPAPEAAAYHQEVPVGMP